MKDGAKRSRKRAGGREASDVTIDPRRAFAACRASTDAPVFGPLTEERPRYVAIPRAALTAITRAIGAGPEHTHARAVYLALWHVADFHPGGTFRVPVEDIGAFIGLRSRSVRAALAKLQRAGVLTWDGSRSLACVPDVAIRNISGPDVAKNWQAQLAGYGDSPAVDRAWRMMGLDTVPDTVSRSETREQGSESRSSETTKGSRPGVANSSSPPHRMVALEGAHGERFDVPIPEWDDLALRRAGNGEREPTIDLVTLSLMTAQRLCGRETDAVSHVRELVERRVDAGESAEELLRRVAVRFDEARRRGADPGAPWLCAPSVFGSRVASKPAAMTDVLVARAFDGGDVDRMALARFEG